MDLLVIGRSRFVLRTLFGTNPANIFPFGRMNLSTRFDILKISVQDKSCNETTDVKDFREEFRFKRQSFESSVSQSSRTTVDNKIK